MPNHHTAGHGCTICTAAYHWMITLSLIAIISIPSDEAFIITSRQSPSQRIHQHSITQSQQRCALPFSFPSTQYFSLNREKKSSHRFQLSNSNDDEEYDPRDSFGRSIRGFQSSALKTTIEVGDTIACKQSIPNQGIYENSSYEITSFYTQYFDEETQKIVKQPLNSLDEVASSKTKDQVYMTLFSPQYHSEAVIVTPEEVGLVSIRDELGSAAWLAVPGFFWVFVAASFYNTYHERTGGSFSDAFWGR
mmetsp:Transcript_35053/g.51382  ORF Transcript_35053/g.51382 Transcript_35053/m.51382 type:complete len:249 (+) Transcript_35053:251-997(+)